MKSKYPGTKLIAFLLFLLLITSGPLSAAVIWVGNSTACSNANASPSISAALFGAAFSLADDEIRLTNTIDYRSGSSPINLIDWHPNALGRLTIAGGYADCSTSPTAPRTALGNTTSDLFTIVATSQPRSNVTFRRLDMSGVTGRAIVANSGAIVTLQNVRIHDNTGGIRISDGGILTMDSASIIEDHNNDVDTGLVRGGAIRCEGTDSLFTISGSRLSRNSAQDGGNLYIGSGCLGILEPGTWLQGYGGGAFSTPAADQGGGAFVDDGGVLVTSGSTNRVTISDHNAGTGGGIMAFGTGRVTLNNTLIASNHGDGGGGIAAISGGSSSPQVIMQRAPGCNLTTTCSAFASNTSRFLRRGAAIWAVNSDVTVYNTYVSVNGDSNGSSFINLSLFEADTNAIIRIDGLGVSRNTAAYIFKTRANGKIVASHVTTSLNVVDFPPFGAESYLALIDPIGTIGIRNSIINDTNGIDDMGGTNDASCNLVDNSFGMPAGSFFMGSAQFVNAANGDIRQLSSSPGVDMCNFAGYLHTGNTDIEGEIRPINDTTNPQGSPGVTNGFYDAGFDEVYDNSGPTTAALTAVLAGAGAGTVSSTPPGILCGGDCNQTYPTDTVVTLFAIPAAGSALSSWSGCDLAGGNQCAVAMTSDRTVTAFFEPESFTLNVSGIGNGAGTVNSDISGINCGGDCTEVYANGTTVVLTAGPNTGSTFVSWGGDCTMTNGIQCTAIMSANRDISAWFTLEQISLNVQRSGAGTGTITSNPTGIDCGTDCSQFYLFGNTVVLTALPAAGSTFGNWSGPCATVSGNQCTVSMDVPKTVTATFNSAQDAVFSDSFE